MTDDFDPTTMLAWVTSPNDLTNLTGILAHHHDPVTIDLETTGLDEHATGDGPREVPARIVLASVTFDYVGRTRTWVIPLSHPDSPFRGQWRAVATTVAQALARHDLIGHNLKFDLRWLYAHTGVDLSTRLLWDSEVSSHLLDENESTKLKERAPDTFGVTRWDDFDLSRPGAAEDVPLFDLGVYAARDTYWTHRLAYNHRSIMWVDLTGVEPWEQPEDDDEREVANLGQLAERVSMPATRTLCQMEQHGLALDTEWTRTTLAELEETAARLAAEMGARYPDADLPGVQSFAATSRWFLGWTEAAVDAGDLVVGELTPTGKPRWSKAVLVRLERKGYPLAGVMLEHRSAVKRAEFLRSWLAKVSPAGGIHATYRIGSVVTGRLSSSSPNMQQVTKALKPAFVPEPGHVLAELDYSQIELRVAAFISRCAPMIEAFQRGDDLHTLLASRITGKAAADVTPIERQAGKSANFGLLYGMGVDGFREYAETVYGVALTEDEAAVIHRTFFLMWDGISAWHQRAIATAHRHGQITSPLGRVRRVPDVHDGNPSRAAEAERAAVNSPVQGMASDLMQIAAASIAGNLAGIPPVDGATLVGTVHDSILVQVPADRWEDVTWQCQERMEGVGEYVARYFYTTIDVPLVADYTVGTRWGLTDVYDPG